MNKAIVFDLDDTLIDRTQAVENFACSYWLDNSEKLGQGKSAFIERVHKLDGGGYQSREDFFKSVSIEYSLTSGEIDEFKKKFFDTVWVKPVVIEGTFQLIEILIEKGYRVGIVSNGSHEAQTAKIKHSGLDQLIDTILISESFGVKKPDPSIFYAICQKLEVEAKNSWFVGDHPINDIWGSKQIGFRTAWLHRDRPWPDTYDHCYDLKAKDLFSLLCKIEPNIKYDSAKARWCHQFLPR